MRVRRLVRHCRPRPWPRSAHAQSGPGAARDRDGAVERQEGRRRVRTARRCSGRTVKDLLAQLPANRVWRAGVDQATTLTTESDLLIGGKRVPAGKYTLYLHAPATGSYALLVNRDLGVPLKSIYAAAPAAVADALWPHLDDYRPSRTRKSRASR